MRILKQKTLGRGSVKEAFDTLPAAICYFTDFGLVKLCNLQMHRLFWAMAHSDLQTLDELHEAIADSKNGVTKLSGEEPLYLFPDGMAWYYAERTVTAGDGKAYTEAVFSDVTELYEKKLELERQLVELREIARELKQLSDHVQVLTREQELLAFKTKLHDQMGAGLLAARQSLAQDHAPEDALAAIRLWRRAVRLVRADNASPEATGGFELFQRDAASIGVAVTLTGALPGDGRILEVFLIAMRECFTNCVRHAGATELYAAVSKEGGSAVIRITNNGAPPEGEITPGGGLSNLTRHVTLCGGRLTIRSQPAFELTVSIPVGKETAS